MLVMVLHVCNPSPREVGNPITKVILLLHNEAEASLDYMRPHCKQNKSNKIEISGQGDLERLLNA